MHSYMYAYTVCYMALVQQERGVGKRKNNSTSKEGPSKKMVSIERVSF